MIMKTIVASTDFSASSLNAVNYAADLAMMTGHSLSVFHVCVVPVAIGEALPVYPVEELYSDAEKEMAKLKDELAARTGGRLTVHSEIRQGGVLPEIYNYCHSVNPWLVVMGAEKAGGVERFLLGGRTVDAIKNMEWPLIVVPADVKFQAIHRIGLACDLKNVEETIPIKQVEDLVHTFNAELYVLHVSTVPGERFDDAIIEQTESLRDVLQHLNPQYKFINDTNIENGLDDFAQRHHVDLLIMVPKRHGFLHKLFYSSQSKKIALTSHVPLLSVHELK
jgi:nucleotide-binding universal stress UspA family protein